MVQEKAKNATAKKSSLLTLSNGLSLARAPLAFLFLQDHATLRLVAIILAMITDSIDGYVARRSQSASRFGAILDPTMDKFFVYFVLTVLHLEGKVSLFEAIAMISRDFAVLAYGFCMAALGRWKAIEFRAIRWGKVITSLQFIVLIGCVLGMSFSWIIFAGFIFMGVLAFIELLQTNNPFSTPSKVA